MVEYENWELHRLVESGLPCAKTRAFAMNYVQFVANDQYYSIPIPQTGLSSLCLFYETVSNSYGYLWEIISSFLMHLKTLTKIKITLCNAQVTQAQSRTVSIEGVMHGVSLRDRICKKEIHR